MRTLAIISIAALALVACGGSSDDDDTTDTPQSTESAPTATTAAQPTATPAATQAPAGTPQTGVEITLVYAMGGPPGGNAYVEATVTPGATCDLDYETPAGTESEAEGLEDRTADADGHIRWDWSISPGTEPGSGEVTVTCGDASQTVSITIG